MKSVIALLGILLFPITMNARNANDSITSDWDKLLQLNEVVIVASRTVVKQAPDRIIYLTKNDQYVKGMNAIEVLDRIPRVSVINDMVSVAGKNQVKYIVDGHLLEMADEAIVARLKNLQANGIEKIEVFTTPPAK